MKKIIKSLLPIFLILINTINISAITFEKLDIEQKIIYRSLVYYSNSNNIEEFIKILATGTNFELTNVEELNIVKIIGYNGYIKPIVEKENFIYILLLYSMLGEVVQQVNAGTRIKRFKKIKNTHEKYLESGLRLFPGILKKILSTEFNPKTKEFKSTSFYWYLYQKVIKSNTVLNPCLAQSLRWFLDGLRIALLNSNFEEMERILDLVPFLVTLKINSLNLTAFAKKHLPKENAKIAISIIKNTERLFSRIEPSIFTAFWRYN